MCHAHVLFWDCLLGLRHFRQEQSAASDSVYGFRSLFFVSFYVFACDNQIVQCCFHSYCYWNAFSVLINYLDSSFIARSICSNLCSFCTQGEFENGFCNIRFFVIGFRFSSRDLVIVL